MATRGLGRNVIVSGFVSLLMDASSEMIYPLVPIFLSSALGVSKSVIGLIEGIAEATAGILKSYSGWLSDRTARRKALMIAGYSISTLSRPILALAGAWHQVLASRFLDRTGKGIRGAPRDALIAESTDHQQMGRAFGFHRMMDTVGAGIGPLIASAILAASASNYRLVFWCSIIPGALAVLTIIFFIRETPHKPGSAHAEPPRLSLGAFGFRYKAFLFVATVFMIGNSSDAFLILKASAVGVPVAAIPIVYFCFNMVYALTAMPAGLLADRIGAERVILAGFLLFAAVYFGFGLASTSAQVWALFMAYGVFMGITEGIHKAYIAQLAPARQKATAFGLYNMFTGFALLPASLMAGWLWDSTGPRATFWLGTATALVAATLFALLCLMPGQIKRES